jgi:hypothetical protein
VPLLSESGRRAHLVAHGEPVDALPRVRRGRVTCNTPILLPGLNLTLKTGLFLLNNPAFLLELFLVNLTPREALL